MAAAKLEVCVTTVQAARHAAAGGADRIELCAALELGGVTPSAGLLQVCRESVDVPVMMMIRPRAGDFCYRAEDLEVMRRDIQIAKAYQVAGIVCGTLDRHGRVARDLLARICRWADPLEVTFHRAFDLIDDQAEALETLVELGITRVLTSGGSPRALDALPRLAELVRQADGRIVVMPGGGIRPSNAGRILRDTGAAELHGSARRDGGGQMRSTPLAAQLAADGTAECCRAEVRELKAAMRAAGPAQAPRPQR